MADAFSHFDAKALLKHKHVLFLGDSNIRAQYKDLVWLLNFNTLISKGSLRSKLERSFLGDSLIERSELHYGRDFQEVRHYKDEWNKTVLDFMFIPRCYNFDLENMFNDFKRGYRSTPDVIVINSCLWDLTRWGPNGVPEYKDNMVKLMRLMKQSLPRQCLVIWTTALPTAAHVRGGLLIKQIEFMEPLLRFEVMEANTFAREIVVSHGFDVLDNHYHTRMQMHRRARDGVHYMPIPVRLMTNLLLTHFALSWGRDLPGNICSLLLNKAIQLANGPVKEEPVLKLPQSGIFSKINLTSPAVPRNRGLQITFNPSQKIPVRRCQLFDQDSSFYHNTEEIPQLQGYSESLEGGSELSSYQGSSQRVHRYIEYREQILPNPQPYYDYNNDVGPERQRRNKRKNKRKNPYRDNQYNYRY